MSLFFMLIGTIAYITWYHIPAWTNFYRIRIECVRIKIHLRSLLFFSLRLSCFVWRGLKGLLWCRRMMGLRLPLSLLLKESDLWLWARQAPNIAAKSYTIHIECITIHLWSLLFSLCLSCFAWHGPKGLSWFPMGLLPVVWCHQEICNIATKFYTIHIECIIKVCLSLSLPFSLCSFCFAWLVQKGLRDL